MGKKSSYQSASIGLLLFCSLFFGLWQSISAQQSLYFHERNTDFRNALDLYEKEKYYAAQEYFEKTIREINDVHSEVRIDAEYYRAICAIELFHDNAAALLNNFIEDHPESPHITSAYFNLAKFQFRKRRYEDVVIYLTQIDPLDLKSDEQAEYYFKKGYAHFQLEEYERSANAFYEIKDTDNPYVSAARYYYAHIAYLDEKYETAAQNFKKIEQDPQFGSLVPYYLTQIYYKQEKYEILLAYAPAVLDSAPPKREEEIRKLIGDAYYETAQYKEAIPYLEAYLKRHSGTDEDYYQLAYANYRLQDYKAAVDAFQQSIRENDTLSQSAYYYIGEASIKLDEKTSARSAFRSAYKLDIDDELTEDALFNFAKVAYELSYHPYDDAILAFEEYINTYPNSKKIKNAYEYLVGVYYTTKNYKEALRSIERIKSHDISLLQAKQRLAYFRGVELFKEEDYKQAIDHFKLSLENVYDPKLKAAAQYWMAESYYRLKQYDNAATHFNDFLAASGSRSLDYFAKGYYHLGYTYYEKRDYSKATFWFREYIKNAREENKGLINDAYLRLGDSYFIQKDYNKAVEFYGEAQKLGVKDVDYAMLQAAISKGVLGDNKGKATLLETLVQKKEQSVYTDDALYELGNTYLNLSKESDALAYYNRLLTDFPNSNYVAETHLKVGLIHYNRKEDDLALNAFDKVVDQFPSSKAASEALEKIRLIYIDKGDATAFEDYLKGVSYASVSESKLDSTSYTIAENNYLSGNCEKANRDFTNYLKRYPNGIFSLNAHFYRGNCEYEANFEQEAIQDFEEVVRRAPNKFIEKSLLKLGELYRSSQKPEKAAETYLKLLDVAERKDHLILAKKALMEIYFEEENYNEAASYAEELLGEGLLNQKLWEKAQLTMANMHLKKENQSLAEMHLDTLSTMKTSIGAEAKYLLAHIYHQNGEFGKSDTMIYGLLDQVPSQPFWIAKGFILLADNYIAKEDFYNAKVTFQSVIDNADDPELVDIAKEKLAILKANEQGEEEEEEPIEIDLNIPSNQEKKDNMDNSTKFDEKEKEVPNE
ncbi:MAG: tetratricopeptide repeat protein [Vicingaceae bacterium]